MSNIRIMAAGKEQWEYTAPFMRRAASEAFRSGVPLTVLAAADEKGIMGVLAGMIDQDSFIIDSLYVDPAKRGLGAGRALIDELDKIFGDGNIAVRAEFNIENEDNETLEGFLTKMGFEEEETDYPMYYRGFVSDLTPDKMKKPEGMVIRSFSETEDRLLREASHESVKEGYPLPDKGLLSKKLDKDSSFCILREGKVVSYVTIEPIDELTLKVPALYSSAEDPRETLFMLKSSVEVLKKKYSPDTELLMLAVNSRSEKIIEHLFENIMPISRSYIKFL